MAGAEAGPLLVFDLRNGRVGGLTFCRIVQGWFRPEQSFMIDNDVGTAVEHWRALPEARRRDMRFVWGHRFSRFQKAAPLERAVRIVGLVRHPLLKVSGVDVRSADALDGLDSLSLEQEFEEYRAEGGALPCGSIDDFLRGHYLLGVTELMEESLALLRARLGVQAPLPVWQRIGAHANLDDNIYSHGLLEAFVRRPQYAREIGRYRDTRRRLTQALGGLTRRERGELIGYKAECAGRDAVLAKWSSAYPDVAAPVVGRPPLRLRRPRLRPRPASRIVPDAGGWVLVLGQGEVEAPVVGEGVAPERDVLSPLLNFRLEHARVAAPPNVLRVELELPAVASPQRWIYGLIGGHRLFQVHLGPQARRHTVELPLSPRLAAVMLLFNQYETDGGGRRLYARVRRLRLTRAPLDGAP